MEATTIKIEGMCCNHCAVNIEKAVTQIPGVTKIEVSLTDKNAVLTGAFNMDDVRKSIESVGYSVVQ